MLIPECPGKGRGSRTHPRGARADRGLSCGLGHYLVELGVTGEGQRGGNPAPLAQPSLTSTLQGRGASAMGAASAARVHMAVAPGVSQQQPPAPSRATPPEATLFLGRGCIKSWAPQGQSGAYGGSALGSLGSNQRLQATAAAGLVLPTAGVFELAGSVELPTNLDALLGAPWEEMPAGPGSPAQQDLPWQSCRPRAGV